MGGKAGLSRDNRRLLGGHAGPKDKSVIVYSRDSMAEPMRALEDLIVKIASDHFRPDETRSGRWVAEASRTSPRNSDGSSSTDSEGTSSESEEDAAEVAEADHSLGHIKDYPDLPEGGVCMNSDRGTLHRASGPDDVNTNCGFPIKRGRSKWSGKWPSTILPLCRRSSCFP